MGPPVKIAPGPPTMSSGSVGWVLVTFLFKSELNLEIWETLLTMQWNTEKRDMTTNALKTNSQLNSAFYRFLNRFAFANAPYAQNFSLALLKQNYNLVRSMVGHLCCLWLTRFSKNLFYLTQDSLKTWSKNRL